MKNILIIGSGGREHALAWKVAQSSNVHQVFVAPGNAGTAMEAKCTNVAIEPADFASLATFAQNNHVAFTIVGPEAPLVAGIVDYFQTQGLACFGPAQQAAQLEGSKTFTKDFLARHQIPTARYQSFTELAQALAYLQKQSLPVVIKADGLAAGKGVVIATDRMQAEQALHDMLSGQAFGEAGQRVVIEEYLDGEEASFMVMVDGEHVLPLVTSQDHKRIGEGDTGANTGGMGAYSPAPVVTEALFDRIMHTIIEPTVRGMAAEGCYYCGFLYAGLMITDHSIPKVIEYNCRLGDPEAQVILLRLQSDLVSLCEAALDHRLDQCHADWDARAAVGVVLAAGGYPASYSKGNLITGLPEESEAGIKVFHAGTAFNGGNVVTQGGRVLSVAALGDNVTTAQKRAYQQVRAIRWDGVYYRQDIAYRAVAREND